MHNYIINLIFLKSPLIFLVALAGKQERGILVCLFFKKKRKVERGHDGGEKHVIHDDTGTAQ